MKLQREGCTKLRLLQGSASHASTPRCTADGPENILLLGSSTARDRTLRPYHHDRAFLNNHRETLGRGGRGEGALPRPAAPQTFGQGQEGSLRHPQHPHHSTWTTTSRTRTTTITRTTITRTTTSRTSRVAPPPPPSYTPGCSGGASARLPLPATCPRRR